MLQQLLAWGNELGWAANLLQVGGTVLATWLTTRTWLRRTFAAEQHATQLVQQNAKQENEQLLRAVAEQRQTIDRLQQDSLTAVVQAAERQRKDNNRLPEINLLMDWWALNSGPLAQVAGRLGEFHAEHTETAALRQAVPYLRIAAELEPGQAQWRTLLTEAGEMLALSDDAGEDGFDIMEHDGRYLDDAGLRKLLDAYRAQCDKLIGSGRYALAVRLSGRALTLARQRFHDPASDDGLSVSFTHAKCLHFAGRAAEALPIAQAALESARAVLPKDHLNTLASAHLVAKLMSDLGRAAEALPIAQSIWDTCKAVLSKDHSSTLLSALLVASLLQDLSRAAEALPIAQTTWDAYKATLPKDHPETLTSAHLVVMLLKDLGSAAEALPIAQTTWDACKATLPKDHPDTLASAQLVANLLKDLGRATEALPIAQSTWETQKAVLSKDHPHTLVSARLVATILQDLGRAAEALPIAQSTWETEKAVLPKDHPNTLVSARLVANLLKELDRAAEALPIAEAAWETQKAVLPKDHPDTLRTAQLVADILQSLGRVTEKRGDLGSQD